MNELFQLLYGKDMQGYRFVKGKGTCINETDDPRPQFRYYHNSWEANYKSFIESVRMDSNKVAKSLKPQLDLCFQKCEEVSASLTSLSDVTEVPSSNFMQTVTCTEAPTMPSAANCATPSRSEIESSSVIDLTESSPLETFGHTAWLTTASELTRKQLSDIDVPQVNSCNSSNVFSVFGAYTEANPLSLTSLPPERLVAQAEVAVRSKNGHQEPTGVTIQGLGTFSGSGVAILKKFCEISFLKAAIRSEDRWLKSGTDGLSAVEMTAIKDVLWNKSTSETVLRAGQKSIDVASFSTLVEERYLDNFVIDVCISRFIQDCQHSKVPYLHSETHTCLQTLNNDFVCRKVGEVLSASRETEFDLVLCPLHMNGSHWGIVVVDLVGRKLLFDDGYKLKPSTSVLPSMKYVLDVLHQLRPNAQCFNSSFWSFVTHFERFGMPSQKDCDATGEGSGSCGVGVGVGSKGLCF